MKVGVIATTLKENEKRVPIHLDHLQRMPEETNRQLYFEKGYGERFHISDEELSEKVGGIATRQELMTQSDAVILLKPMPEDFLNLRENTILWGWPHCVQQRANTQAAIDKKLTLMAFEEMYAWGPDGHQGLHTFYKNNELAGYCAVLHALYLKGLDGHYGKQRKVVIFSFGAVSRGAIYALKARGFRDITICVRRPDHLVREEVLGCHYVRMREGRGEGAPRMVTVEHDGTEKPLLELLKETDIMVNGIFQDPNNPVMFITEEEIPHLKKGCLILDVSCDEAMGFPFAKPTSFKDPMFSVGHIDYYAVDHTPSYLWESASWEISTALVRYLPYFVKGPEMWQQIETFRRAIEIDQGVIINPAILEFQKRQTEYPHLPLA